MNSTQQQALTNFPSEKIAARAKGYFFSLQDERWILDKNYTVNVGQVAEMLSEPTRGGFLLALSHYARELSGSHTRNIAERFHHMIRTTEAREIDDTVLINYRSTLERNHEWYLATIGGFLVRWHRLGYPGVSDDVVRLLQNWRLKGNIKGDAVKRLDPNEGPLSDIELFSFNEGVVQAFEKNVISLSQLALSLIVSNTGRRPIQVSHLRCGDVVFESPRELRRLHYLREWSHEQVEQVFTGNQRARGTDGAGSAQGLPLAMGGG